ncbi:M43 family zinc metalloprotease [Luteibaculum oceani]|uniref:PKD domain-containing protein n=1 Tax=Luteibaculum oceani TaxID=1294296 RepID=A0A5C6UV61_9FLAO|nr:M43 family zinc metalloprotease [Luteibaculum oceani]TXC76036.1 PKD domain-containing protein [Luteibaculum oceani]
MKKSILLISFLNFCFLGMLIGQQAEPCGFDAVVAKQIPFEIENTIQEAALKRLSNATLKSHDTLRTIPVVVHVFHTGGAGNISESQVASAINVLNEDFQKLDGTAGYGEGVNTLVQFKLAKIDPNGNCTNGIIRINSTLANHQSYQRGLLKDVSAWDNKKYLNIYVVKSIAGSVAGYASFPGGPDAEDGIVVQNNFFGRSGTAAGSTGRTTTHEVGHWLGLYHTFQNGCDGDPCTGGDYVCDTPPQSEPNYECIDLNTCSNDDPDVMDQKENYMNYTPGSCQNMFTAGQAARIHGTLDSLRTYIWSYENLLTTGCDPNYQEPTSCPLVADFTVVNTALCVGNSVDFIEKSQNNPVAWSWYFEGGSPSTSSEQNPQVTYTEAGEYDVKLVIEDALGNKDSIIQTDYIKVSEPGIGADLPFFEDMESGNYPPASLELVNHDGGITWELDSNAAFSGRYSLRINNLINTNYGSADELILPPLNLASATSTPLLRIKYAYAKSDETYSDELLVLLSTDCGASFEQVMYKTQESLATAPTTTDYFIPDSSQWDETGVLLWKYRNEEHVILKIVNVTDGGNNLYIDDIFVGDKNSDPTGVTELASEIESAQVYPNPNKGEATLDYRLKRASEVSVVIQDVQGRVIFSEYKGLLQAGAYSEKLELNNLNAGVYFVQIHASTGVITLKMYVR